MRQATFLKLVANLFVLDLGTTCLTWKFFNVALGQGFSHLRLFKSPKKKLQSNRVELSKGFGLLPVKSQRLTKLIGPPLRQRSKRFQLQQPWTRSQLDRQPWRSKFLLFQVFFGLGLVNLALVSNFFFWNFFFFQPWIRSYLFRLGFALDWIHQRIEMNSFASLPKFSFLNFFFSAWAVTHDPNDQRAGINWCASVPCSSLGQRITFLNKSTSDWRKLQNEFQ